MVLSSILQAQPAQFFCSKGSLIIVGSTNNKVSDKSKIDQHGGDFPISTVPPKDTSSSKATGEGDAPSTKGGSDWRSYPKTAEDLDGDGIPNEQDRCPNTPWKFLPVDNRGCSTVDKDQDGCGADEDDNDEIPGPFECGCVPCIDDDHDGIHNRRDECPQEPGSLSNRGCPQIMDFPALDSIAFSSKDFSASYEDLMGLKSKLRVAKQQNPNIEIFLIGLGDAATDGEQVYFYAQKRIETIKRKLSDWGFPTRMVSSEAQRSSPIYKLPRAVYIFID